MLRGERVTLRAIEREDLPRLHALGRNVELATLADGAWNPSSLAKAERDFEQNGSDPERSWFGIEADGQLIGSVGLHHKNRREGTAELGVGIYDPEYVGRGYGREAIGLLLEWAFVNQNWRRVWLQTGGSNERAIRAYQACGFVVEGRLREHCYTAGVYEDALVMGLLRREWEERGVTR